MKENELKPSISTLVLSIASSAAISLGLSPNPSSNKVEKDLNMAEFNIDLLRLLKEKTQGNLTGEETKFFDSVITDLQLKYVELSRVTQ